LSFYLSFYAPVTLAIVVVVVLVSLALVWVTGVGTEDVWNEANSGWVLKAVQVVAAVVFVALVLLTVAVFGLGTVFTFLSSSS